MFKKKKYPYCEKNYNENLSNALPRALGQSFLNFGNIPVFNSDFATYADIPNIQRNLTNIVVKKAGR